MQNRTRPARLCVILSIAFILGTGVLLIASTAAQASKWAIVDLGSITKDGESTGAAINNNGDVVGSATTEPGYTHPFLWVDGKMKDLGTFDGNNGYGHGINDLGVGCGNTENQAGNETAFRTGINDRLASLGISGVSEAYAINGDGQVTGLAGNEAFDYYESTSKTFDIGYPTGYTSSAGYGINSNGTIAGLAGSETALVAAVWTPSSANGSTGTWSVLSTLGGSEAAAYAINDSGEVAGFSELSGSSDEHAFLYADGIIYDLGTLGGTSSTAYGINADGVVVGWASTSSSGEDAFMWTPSTANGTSGTMLDLNTLLPVGSGWILSTAYSINSLGQIVGTGHHEISGVYYERAFLLSPFKNPKPHINSISPTSVVVKKNATIDIKGTGFTAGSIAYFNKTPLDTTPISSDELTAAIPASLLKHAGQFPIKAENAPPGGGTSNTVELDVT